MENPDAPIALTIRRTLSRDCWQRIGRLEVVLLCGQLPEPLETAVRNAIDTLTEIARAIDAALLEEPVL